MKKPRPTFTWEQLDELLEAHGAAPDRNVPPDAFTAAEFAARYGVNETTARYRLQRLVRCKLLSIGMDWRVDARGRRRLVQCFWISGGGEKG